jgi:nucleoside-diphosphate-sugar epimerase
MQSALVTGATGFIGRQLCQKLQSQGVRVTAAGRHPTNGPWDLFLTCDMTDPATCPDLAGIDTVFHLAGKAHALAETKQDEAEYFRINSEGTRLMLEAARQAGVRRFVLFSSVKAAGEGGFECQDETAACQPQTPYGASKLAAEKLVLEGGFVPEPVVLRPSMVYGPSEKGNLPRMIEAVARGRFPPLPEVGNRRSMVHVEDMVQAACLAAEKPEAIGQVFIVTDGTPYSTRQMYAWICEAVGKSVPQWNLPLPVLAMLARTGDMIGWLRGRRFVFDSDALDKLIGSACYNSARIEQMLGFAPSRHLYDSLPGIVSYLRGEA